MKHRHWLWSLSLGLGLAIGGAVPQAAELPERRLAQGYGDIVAVSLLQHYQAGYPAPVLTYGMASRQVDAIHRTFVRRLMEEAGPIVGYKLALSNPQAQAQVGVNHPLYGFLLEEMLLDSGSSLPLQFGSRPRAEGDLMVRVGSADINEARTDAELLAALDAVFPFLELPDLVYQENSRPDAGALVAVNVGARFGILGEEIALADDASEQLGNIRVVLENSRGQFLAEGNSQTLLGHPVNAVRWLRDTLQLQGVELKPGDMLSLGSMTPLIDITEKELAGIQAHYFGLDSRDSVTMEVVFEGSTD